MFTKKKTLDIIHKQMAGTRKTKFKNRFQSIKLFEQVPTLHSV